MDWHTSRSPARKGVLRPVSNQTTSGARRKSARATFSFRRSQVSGPPDPIEILRGGSGSEPVLQMVGAGDSPASVGDSPSGTAESTLAKRPCRVDRTATYISSGESPDETGGSPVLPKTVFQTR